LPESTPSRRLSVARIVRPHGIRGEVVADLLTDFPERFSAHPLLLLRAPGAASPTRSVEVLQARPHAGRMLLKLSGCDSMNDAEALRGYELVIPWEDRTPLDSDSVYIAELVGCRLIDTTSGQTVGEITGVDRESTQLDLLVVQPAEAGREELLIPFVKAYAPAWDMEQRTMHMALPAGLLDLDTPVAGEGAKNRSAGEE
jgi:16S rRNA processing protein RimM